MVMESIADAILCSIWWLILCADLPKTGLKQNGLNEF